MDCQLEEYIKENISEMVRKHLAQFGKRYCGMTEKEVKYELRHVYNIRGEIERITRDNRMKMCRKERDMFRKAFIKEVVSVYFGKQAQKIG